MVKGEKRRLRFSYTEHDGKAGKVAKDVNENMARATEKGRWRWKN